MLPSAPRRLLLLTDIMSVCLAFGRRRTCNFKLLCAVPKNSASVCRFSLDPQVNTADPPPLQNA